MEYRAPAPEQVGEIIVALEIALRGLECGADQDAHETGFVACWNALHTLGRRGDRIGPDDDAPESDATMRYPMVAGRKVTAALVACRDGLVCDGDLNQALDAIASVRGTEMAAEHAELFDRAERAALAFRQAEAAGAPVPAGSPHRWVSVAVDDALAALGHDRLYNDGEHAHARVGERGSQGAPASS